MGVAELFYKSRIHGQSLPSQANHRPTSALVQVQEQNDEADPNINDFKQILTKFKHKFKTLLTAWRVEYFLQFREGVIKSPTLL